VTGAPLFAVVVVFVVLIVAMAVICGAPRSRGADSYEAPREQPGRDACDGHAPSTVATRPGTNEETTEDQVAS
jgi:hypothetical protein